MRADALYALGVQTLLAAHVPEADLDAWYLFSEVTDWDRAFYCAHTDEEIGAALAERYMNYVNQRAKRIPLHRVLGERDFMGFPMYVTEDTLVPRLDTECVVEEAYDLCRQMLAARETQETPGKETEEMPADDPKRGLRVLDICTGSGCILIALASLLKEDGHADPEDRFCGVDLNEGALETAKRNAERNMVDIKLIRSDLTLDLREEEALPYDLIVSNPPYIPTPVIGTLEPEVREYDPMMALDGGYDGLDFYRRLAKETLPLLKHGGYLVLEIGDDQGKSVPKLLAEAGFTGITVKQDLSGHDRVVTAVRKQKEMNESEA